MILISHFILFYLNDKVSARNETHLELFFYLNLSGSREVAGWHPMLPSHCARHAIIIKFKHLGC